MGGLMIDARGEPVAGGGAAGGGGGGGGGGAGVLTTGGLVPYGSAGLAIPAEAIAGALLADVAVISGVAYYVLRNPNTGEIVEVGDPVDPADSTYDDNGAAAAPSMSPQTADKMKPGGERMNDDVGGGGPLTESEMNGAPATPTSGSGGGSDTPTYDDSGYAADTSSGGSSRRKSSGGGGGGGGGTATEAAPAQPVFPGGGFGTPNSYPTLPMTPQRQKVLQNLSGPFGPNVGTFRAPPGGWREDMAPMFTTGAFGGVQPPAESSAIPGGPPMSAPAPAPAIPDYSAFLAPPAPAPAPNGMPSLPDPTLMPPGAEMGIAPPEDPYAAPAMPVGFPAFNRPGFVAPGSPAAMQMQRQMPQGGNAAPLPASIRQRFGL